EPPGDVVAATTGSPLQLSLDTRARQPGVSVAIGWTVDGTPAGAGRSLTLRPQRAGRVTVRAVATTQTGGTASREWRVAVEPAVEIQTAAASPEREAAGEREPSSERPTATERPGAGEDSVPTERHAPPAAARRPPVPRKAEVHSASPQEEVRWLLERSAAAWRARDIQALRDVGQIP